MNRWVEAEFEAVFREHYRRMVQVVRRVLRSDAEAEEVCAEVFLRLYRAGPAVATTGPVGGWLYRTATRAAIDALRSQQRRGLEVELDNDRAATVRDPGDSPLSQLLARERVAQVRAVLATLKVEKAQILLLRQSGLSYQEIAAAMRISANSVGTKLARAEAEFCSRYQRRQPQQQRRRQEAQSLKTAKEEP